MKLPENLDQRVAAVKSLLRDWNLPEDIGVEAVLSTLIPELSSEIRQDPSFSELSALDTEFFEMLCSAGQLPLNSERFPWIRACLKPGTESQMDSDSAARLWMTAIRFAPISWIEQIYRNSSDSRKHAIFLILSANRKMRHLDPVSEEEFGEWLTTEASEFRVFLDWLCGKQSVLKKRTSAKFYDFFAAIRRSEQGDPDWTSGWMTENFQNIQPYFWPQSEETGTSFVTFYGLWLSEAWLETGNPQKAAETLESCLEQGGRHPGVFLQQARVFTELGALGEAVQALELVLAEDPRCLLGIFPDSPRYATLNPEKWGRCVEKVQDGLARAALHQAMISPEPDFPLLELAMTHGQKETFAEAALCWFDSGLGSDEFLCELLAKNQVGCAQWIQQLVTRGEPAQPDRLYGLCRILRQKLNNQDNPELDILEAMTQLDNPWQASDILIAAMDQLSCESELFWAALKVWIRVKTAQNEFAETVRPLIRPLMASNSRALAALRMMIGAMPREAARAVQNLLMEEVGSTDARKILESLVKPIPSVTSPLIQEPEISFCDQTVWMLPLSWQYLYRCARLANPPASIEQAHREEIRNQVIVARERPHAQTFPGDEPVKWIHQRQPRASDAFD